MSNVLNDISGQVRPGVLSLSIKEKSALFAAYMPFIKGGGLFIPTNKQYKMGEEVFMLLCRSCHTVDGYLAIRPLVEGKSASALSG